MRITWRERLALQPGLWEFRHWPVISLDHVPRSRRKAFLRNQQIVAQVLAHTPVGTVATQHNVTPGRVSQLLQRCLGGDEDTPPALTPGLIPYRVVVDNQRQDPLPTLRKSRGNACAFRLLLKAVPGLRESLDALLQASIDDKNYAQRPTPQALHGEFKRVLDAAQWPRDQYPYTTVSLAYESVRRYLPQRYDELLQAKLLKKPQRPRNLGLARSAFRALRALQIDEHSVDLTGRVNLQLNEHLIPLRLARGSLLVARDVDSTCNLGFVLVPTRYPSQQDLLQLFDTCIQPWRPLDLATPGFSYAPGAAFPSGLEGGFPISFGTVQLDNALLHRAHSVIDLICEQYGGTLSYGLPALPKPRHLVEAVFNYINRHVSHRVDSTTGSYPTDPNKESRKNRKKPPVITFQTLLEAISIVLAEENITPIPSRGGATPLDLFQHHCSNHYVRYVPRSLSEQWQPLLGETELPLHWYQHEKRLPFVNLYYERYQGPGLLRVAAHAKRIRVRFDYRDLRTLRAFSLDGADLGELQVSTPWQRFAHSLATRQWIHKHAKQYRLNTRDPLAAYFHYLLEHKDLPATALSLLRVYTEFTRGQGPNLILGGSGDAGKDHPALPQEKQSRIWHPDMANHRD
jgi:hypothetical protein